MFVVDDVVDGGLDGRRETGKLYLVLVIHKRRLPGAQCNIIYASVMMQVTIH